MNDPKRPHPLVKVANLLSYPRGVVLTIFGATWTLIMAAVILTTAVVVRNRRIVDFTINQLWAWPLIKLSGVRVLVRGAENVRRDGQGFALLFNHASFFDILVLYLYFPRTFRFGAKIELFKIPLVGAAMRSVGVLPIDRRNRDRVMQIYAEATARIDRGESFALAPEGTRQNEPVLGPFKRGPFEFAINAQMDLVPVVIVGAFEVMPPHTIWINVGRWRRTVILDIAEPTSGKGLKLDDAPALQERTREVMARHFAAARAELARLDA